jgi:hypothetical protein
MRLWTDADKQLSAQSETIFDEQQEHQVTASKVTRLLPLKLWLTGDSPKSEGARTGLDWRG